jgi:hypothetical protein
MTVKSFSAASGLTARVGFARGCPESGRLDHRKKFRLGFIAMVVIFVMANLLCGIESKLRVSL